MTSGPRRGAEPRLTQTERRVVELVCEGLTNPQIAQRLSVSPRTVQGHLLKVFRKYGVSSRTQLAVQVMGRGDLQDGGPKSREPGGTGHRNAPSSAQGQDPEPQTFNSTSDRDRDGSYGRGGSGGQDL